MPVKVIESAPAKVNLLLAVHGPRPDGFHDLTSLVVPCAFGDRLEISIAASRASGDQLSIKGPVALQVDEENLILRAARAFRERSGDATRYRFDLEKRIPIGAGLGGGSSDAVAALRGMNRLSGNPVAEPVLCELASELGSDCPLFLDSQPKIMRGRGDRLTSLDRVPEGFFQGRKILIFKPPFGIPTAWAYGALRREPTFYDSEEKAASILSEFESTREIGSLLLNSFEPLVRRKFLAFRLLMEEAGRHFGRCVQMSGSGSAAFALTESDRATESFRQWFEEQFGGEGFFIESFLL